MKLAVADVKKELDEESFQNFLDEMGIKENIE